jgi:hypothetical protein
MLEKLAALRADTAHKRELIVREFAEFAREAPVIKSDRDTRWLWRPTDPQVTKAMVYIRARMRELAKTKIKRNYV